MIGRQMTPPSPARRETRSEISASRSQASTSAPAAAYFENINETRASRGEVVAVPDERTYTY